MKMVVRVLIFLIVIGLAAGVVLLVLEKAAVAGVVWAATSLISCIAYRVEKNIANRV